MFKINIMQIMKFITAVVCFSLFGFAVYSMNQSKASPLPALICACMLYVVDGIFFAMLAIKVLRPLCEHFLFIQIEKNSHFSTSSH